MLRRLAAVMVVAGCSDKPTPAPIAPAPPLSVPAMPPASVPRPAGPPLTSGDNEADEVAHVVAVLARSLNEGEGVRANSTGACWAKECGSLSEQAQRKFKVRPIDDPRLRGTRAVATMDILCEGKRPCDRVYLLLAKDCGPDPSLNWLVADVTEDEPKRDAWVASPPPPCR